jgi:hypothetical protein
LAAGYPKAAIGRAFGLASTSVSRVLSAHGPAGTVMSGTGPKPSQRLSRVRRRAGTGQAPRSLLIGVAARLLTLIGGSALFVSFSAQYAYILAVRRQDAASVIEALLLDLLMIVFTLLALGLSRAGQSARAERALILLCAVAPAFMNVSAANVASPQSVAAPNRSTNVDAYRCLPSLTLEPVSGFEPLACRLQEVRPPAPHALPAQMARVIALAALAALGLSDDSFHEPFHAQGSGVRSSATVRNLIKRTTSVMRSGRPSWGRRF